MGEVIKREKGGRLIGWYLRYVDADGRRKQRASHQPSHAQAKRMLVEIEARIARGKLGIAERPEQLRVGELIERFVTEYDSPRVRDRAAWEQKARTGLASMLPELSERDAVCFPIDAAERLRNQLLRRYKPNTVRQKLAYLATAFAWALRKGLVTSNPFAGLRKPRAEHRVEYLSREEVQQLLATADAHTDERSRVAAIAVRLGVYAGLRVGEIFGLTWRCVDLKAKLLTVSKSYESATKSGKTRQVPMADELVAALSAWRQHCPATREGVVCPVIRTDPGSVWSAVKRRRPELVPLYRVAGLSVPSSPWHALRHTFASHFLMSGGGLLTLQRLLGHHVLKMTALYGHLSSEHVAIEVRRLSFAKG